MAEPRTIDNLGVETSTRWARDQALLDPSMIKEAPTISRKTEIDVTQPFASSELEIMLGFSGGRTLPWALFVPPELYYEQKRRIFTYQLVASLGSEEQKEAASGRVTDYIARHAQEESQEEKNQDRAAKWKKEKEKAEAEKQKNILLHLIQSLLTYDRYLVDINSRRHQYQKG